MNSTTYNKQSSINDIQGIFVDTIREVLLTNIIPLGSWKTCQCWNTSCWGIFIDYKNKKCTL
jgi:hypothetical protein